MTHTLLQYRPTALALALATALGPASTDAVVYDLCATTGTVSMPDGTAVPIWGYVPGATCAAGDATLPGPVLEVPPGDTVLTVNLYNNLPVETSIFITGQAKDPSDPQSPVGGHLPGDRVTSFDKTAPVGGWAPYSWAVSPGTYLYQSGTDIRTQVPMGLYGALVVQAGTGEAYPGVGYGQDLVLVFSEIDPSLNADPLLFGGARVSGHIDPTVWEPVWNPRYFLINGRAYDPADPPLAIETATNVLLRLVNAGQETFVPTLRGLYMTLLAEDGNPYPHPMQAYGVELPAAKTVDAMIFAQVQGSYALYDRALHLSNGGMLTFLDATLASGAPTAVADSYAMDEDGTLIADGVATNPDGVLFNDTGGAVQAVLVADTASGVLSLADDGSFTYTPSADFFGVDQFSYVANDGAGGPNSNVAIASITVNGVPDTPVAAADFYDAVEGQVLVVAGPGVLLNDADADGDALTAQNATTPTIGSLGALGTDGGFDFDATGLTAGDVASFDYDACDPGLLCSSATVTVTVVAAPPPPVNIAPTANDDTTSTPRNTPLVDYDIVANDVDPDGTINPASVVITTGSTTQAGGSVIDNGDGTVTYTPRNPGYQGTDTFQYTVEDNDGATSNVATVRINVVR